VKPGATVSDALDGVFDLRADAGFADLVNPVAEATAAQMLTRERHQLSVVTTVDASDPGRLIDGIAQPPYTRNPQAFQDGPTLTV